MKIYKLINYVYSHGAMAGSVRGPPPLTLGPKKIVQHRVSSGGHTFLKSLVTIQEEMEESLEEILNLRPSSEVSVHIDGDVNGDKQQDLEPHDQVMIKGILLDKDTSIRVYPGQDGVEERSAGQPRML